MKQDLKALEEILDFLLKSKKAKKEEPKKEEVDMEEEELGDYELEEDEEEEEDVRQVPGKKKAKTYLSFSELAMKSKPKMEMKKKGKK